MIAHRHEHEHEHAKGIAPVADNSEERVQFRRHALDLQAELQRLIDAGAVEAGAYPVTHYFTPKDTVFGCYVYAREIFLPKGHVIIGKIHRHAHLAFLLKGKISVMTESGPQCHEAPYTFISEPGIKRVAYVEEDTIWTTVHLTHYGNEADLENIEDEVIAKTYGDIGLDDTPRKLTGQGGDA